MIYIRKRLKKAIECRVDEIADQEDISFSKAQIWLAKYLESKTVSNHIFDHIDTIIELERKIDNPPPVLGEKEEQ